MCACIPLLLSFISDNVHSNNTQEMRLKTTVISAYELNEKSYIHHCSRCTKRCLKGSRTICHGDKVPSWLLKQNVLQRTWTTRHAPASIVLRCTSEQISKPCQTLRNKNYLCLERYKYLNNR